MNQAQAAAAYAESETKYLPSHFDEKLRHLIRFMLLEAFNAGANHGHNTGLERAFDIAADAIQERQSITLNRQQGIAKLLEETRKVVRGGMAILEQAVNNKRSYVYRLTLDVCGYTDSPPTEEAVRECFVDYVAAGYFENLEMDDVNELEITAICRNLIGADKRGRAIQWKNV